MEVVLHYRAWQKDPTVLQKITEEALKEFPVRQPPNFTPWFLNDIYKPPIKPKRKPPVVSVEEAEHVKQHFAAPEATCDTLYYDCTEGLQEFHPNITPWWGLQAQNSKVNLSSLEKELTGDRPKLRRSWSMSVPNPILKNKIFPLSKELQSTLEKLKLHSFYRAQWIIGPNTFNNQAMEDIWIKLNRMIKHNELPSSNATIQRSEGQILVFCDILYCEYVGSRLKEKLDLEGKINMSVHKYGIIHSL